MDQDIEKITAIIEEKSKRYQSKMGEVTLAGIEGGTVKIAPVGLLLALTRHPDSPGRGLAKGSERGVPLGQKGHRGQAGAVNPGASAIPAVYRGVSERLG